MDPEPLQVYIVHPRMIAEFHRWVDSMGWHLQGPVIFEEGDTPTHFLQPGRSEAELHEMLRRIEGRLT